MVETGHSATLNTAGGPGLPERSRWAVVGTLAGALFGGVAVGSGLARVLAPESIVAAFVGFLTLPLVLGTGYQIWQARIMSLIARRFGRGLVRALWQSLILRRKPQLDTLMPTREDALLLLRRMIQAASAFTYAGVLVGAGAGLLVGWAAPGGRFWLACGLFIVVSTLYGRALTLLARAGYVPPPDGE